MRTTALWTLLLGVMACSGSNAGMSDGGRCGTDAGLGPCVGESARSLIGPEGGQLTLGAVVVQIPPGALTEATNIRVVVTDETVPPGLTPYSPVLRFEPVDVELAAPIQITIPFTGNARVATIFAKTMGTDAYAALTTQTGGADVASAEATHLGRAFVGTGCAEGVACTRGTGDADVLFMIDNSNSTIAWQERLIAAVPELLRAMTTGDVDGDGVQDFAAARSVHFGVVSIDMGSGGFTVPTCSEPNFGDDGVMRTQGNTFIDGCSATYPSFLRYDAEAAGFDASSTDDFTCVASLGVGGCGFEQPLESVLKAVTPSSSMLTFFRDTEGHGDTENAGFVRDDASLAVVLLTDEDDCSAADPDLYNIASTRYGDDLNLRCFRYPEALYPGSRYVDGLLALKSFPGRVVFSVIGGIPPDVTSHDPSVVVADPRMMAAPDETMPSRLTPVCNTPGAGIAMPAERLVRTAQAFAAADAHAYVGSVCLPDHDDLARGIAEQISLSLGGG